MEFSVLSLFWECVLTIAKISTRWRVPKYFKKGDFYLCRQLDLLPILLLFSPSVTLVTAKNPKYCRARANTRA